MSGRLKRAKFEARKNRRSHLIIYDSRICLKAMLSFGVMKTFLFRIQTIIGPDDYQV